MKPDFKPGEAIEYLIRLCQIEVTQRPDLHEESNMAYALTKQKIGEQVRYINRLLSPDDRGFK